MSGPSARAVAASANLRNDAAAAEVIKAFDAAGIRSILLKGPSTARWLYDEDEQRQYGDVDLLVAPDDQVRTASVLTGLRFHSAQLRGWHTGWHEREWLRDVDAVMVEVHRTFPGLTVSDEEAWIELSGETEQLDLVDEAKATVLRPAARLVVLALHVLSHGGTHAGSAADLARAVSRVDGATWDEAARFSKRLGAEAGFALGLSFVAGGADIATRNGLSADEATMTTRLQAMAAPPLAMGLAAVAEAKGIRRLLILVQEVAPPADFMRENYPVAARGRAGLGLAYLARPFRLLRRLPAGLRAYRAAYRAQKA